jgi:thiosulfate dehydrogenase
MAMRRLLVPGLVAVCATLTVSLLACTSKPVDLALENATASIPSGPDGGLIRYGRSIVDDTQHTAKQYVVADMNCSACHSSSGIRQNAGSFLGIFALFPQYNNRAHRFITLEDRIAECFLNSMNGRPPSYTSREMIATVAYIAWLSRGAKVGVGFPSQAYHEIPAQTPDTSNGATLYAATCASCHGASGAGIPPALPPLWGPTSFNDDAGMSHVARMASFIRYNMPVDKPGSLTDKEAYDIASWVLTHPRPKFDQSKLVNFAPRPASFY